MRICVFLKTTRFLRQRCTPDQNPTHYQEASTPAKGDLIVKGVPSPGRRTLRGRHCKDLIELYVIVASQLLRTAGKRALQPLFQRLVELLRSLHLRPVTRLELNNFRTWHEFLHRGFPELRAADVVARRSNEQGRFLYRPRFCRNGCVRGSTIRGQWVTRRNELGEHSPLWSSKFTFPTAAL